MTWRWTCKDPEQIRDDLDLARAARSSADADRGNGEPLRDERGEFGGYKFDDNRGGASRLKRERIGE